MAELTFSLAYEGPALEDGSMEVRALAPSLLALADVFRLGNATVNPQAAPVTLEIRSTDRGSFEIHLILQQPDVLSTLVDMLSGQRATALANLFGIVAGFGGASIGALGLFELIKRLGGRRIAERRDLGAGTVRLILDDQTVLEFRADVLLLYQNVTIRRRATEVVAPLRSEGVEAVVFRQGDQIVVRIEKGDLGSFDAPAIPPLPLLDSTTELNLMLVAVSFQEDNKWRFTDGERVFYASVEDDGYMKGVSNGEEAFRSGDILRVMLRVHQQQEADGDLKTEYTVERVLEHIARERAVQLPMVEPPGDAGSGSVNQP
jgi:hypothetical protein